MEQAWSIHGQMRYFLPFSCRATMRHVKALHWTPQLIELDNGSEFISVALDQ